MSFDGEVIAIHLAPARGAPVAPVDTAEAVVDLGLRGDRHFGRKRRGKAQPHRALTLVAEEDLAHAAALGVVLAPGESRRNLLVRGVPLNELVGRRFRVGGVLLEGTELCEPCGHLAKLTGQPVLEALRHRGGLCARILEGGPLAPGDRIRPAEGLTGGGG